MVETPKIKCPEQRFEKILSRLSPMKFEQLRLYANEDLIERIKSDFPDLDETSLNGIYIIALSERRNFIQTFEDILYYSRFGENEDAVEAAKKGLALHVEECKRSYGMCHDRYMLWLERKARKLASRIGVCEEEIPGFINKIDNKYLRLFPTTKKN